MMILSIASSLTVIINSLSILLNCLLMFAIQRFSKNSMGFYKWLMTFFSFYELLYACTVILIMPLHFVYQRAWIAVSYRAPLSRWEFATDATSFYCVLYAAWLGLVLVNFIYRYINLCRIQFAILIMKRLWIKLCLILSYLTFVALTSYCAYAVCRRSHPSEEFLQELQKQYGLETNQYLSYIMVRIYDPETGDISIGGIVAVVVHMSFLAAWLTIICFCGWKIWDKIQEMQKKHAFINVALEKQLFAVLVLQTVIPLFFAGIPSLIHFTFPLWEEHAIFSPLSPFFTVVSSIPKLVDPAVTILCIKGYREGLKKILGIPSFHSNSSSVLPLVASNPENNNPRKNDQVPQTL